MTTSLTKQFRVFRGPSAVVTAMGPNVLALAGFDGVHTGHQALLRRAAEEAAERGLPVGAATFDDRKRTRRGGHKDLPALSSLSDRLRLMRDAGMDFVVLFPGNPATLGIPEEVFTHRILLGVMKTQLVVLRGRDGSSGSGSTATEPDIEAIAVSRVGPSCWVSTTRVRERLGVGDVEAVNELLGRPYALTATVRDAAGGWTIASVPLSRVIPAPGHYRVALEFASGSERALVESMATIFPAGSDPPGRVHLAIDRPVDHGRLRVGFLARCTAAEVTEPAKRRSESVVTASPRYEVR
ncbi:MAG TPA: hypothetical protein VIU11_06035 [Nakamurella sp.]